MELTRRHFVAGSIGALALPLVGCGNDVTNDLDLLLTATEAAVDIAFPQYATLLTPYFDSVTSFIDQVDTELASTDAPAVKASVIAADAAKIVAPDLSGVAASIVTKIGAIAPLVAQVVADVKNLVSELDSYPGGANAFFAAKKVKSPGSKDLEKVRSRNAAIKAKIAAAKPKAFVLPDEFIRQAVELIRHSAVRLNT